MRTMVMIFLQAHSPSLKVIGRNAAFSLSYLNLYLADPMANLNVD